MPENNPEKELKHGVLKTIVLTSAIAASMAAMPTVAFAADSAEPVDTPTETPNAQGDAVVEAVSTVDAVNDVVEHADTMTQEADPDAPDSKDGTVTEATQAADAVVDSVDAGHQTGVEVGSRTEGDAGASTETGDKQQPNSSGAIISKLDGEIQITITEDGQEKTVTVADILGENQDAKDLKNAVDAAKENIQEVENQLGFAKEAAEDHTEEIDKANQAVRDAQAASDRARTALTEGQETIDKHISDMNAATTNAQIKDAYDKAVTARNEAQAELDAAKVDFDAAEQRYHQALENAQSKEQDFNQALEQAKAAVDAAKEQLETAEKKADALSKAVAVVLEKYEAMAKDDADKKAENIRELEKELSGADAADTAKQKGLFESIVQDYYFPVGSAQEGMTVEVITVEVVTAAIEGTDTQNFYKITYTFTDKDGKSEEKTVYMNYSLKSEKDQLVIQEHELVSVTKEQVEKDGQAVYLVDGVAYTLEQMLKNPDFTELEDGSFVKFTRTEGEEPTILVDAGEKATPTGKILTVIGEDRRIEYSQDENGNVIKTVFATVGTREEINHTIYASDDVKAKLVNKFRYKKILVDDPTTGKKKWAYDQADRTNQRNTYWAAHQDEAMQDLNTQLTEFANSIGAIGLAADPKKSVGITTTYEVRGTQSISVGVGTGALDVDKLVGNEKYQNRFRKLAEDYQAALAKNDTVAQESIRKQAEAELMKVIGTEWSTQFKGYIADINAKYSETTGNGGIAFFDNNAKTYSVDNPRYYEYDEEKSGETVLSGLHLASVRWDEEQGKFVTTGLENQYFINNYFTPIVDVDTYREGTTSTGLSQGTKDAFNAVKESIASDLKQALVKFMSEVTEYKDQEFWGARIGRSSYGDHEEELYYIDHYNYKGEYILAKVSESEQAVERSIGEDKQVYKPEITKNFDEYDNSEFRDWVRMSEKIKYYGKLQGLIGDAKEKIVTAKADVDKLSKEIDDLKLKTPDTLGTMVDGGLKLVDARKPFKDPATPPTPPVTPPDRPDVPDTPVIPNTPDVPDTPVIPNTPDIPDVPDTPVIPDTPDTSEIPEHPDDMNIPDPEVPQIEQSSIPEQTIQPAQSVKNVSTLPQTGLNWTLPGLLALCGGILVAFGKSRRRREDEM